MHCGQGLQKVVRCFLDADDNPYFHQNLITTFGPFTIFLEICMQIHSVVFALNRQSNKQKVCENNYSPSRAGYTVFVKCQAQGGRVNPNPPCVRPCLLRYFEVIVP